MNPVEQLLNTLAAIQFRADHPIPDDWASRHAGCVKDVKEMIEKYAKKVEEGYCPIKADRELREEVITYARFIDANGGCSAYRGDLSTIA